MERFSQQNIYALEMNHVDLERYDRRSSSIVTVDQLETQDQKMKNQQLSAVAYIGLLTIVISFVSAFVLLASFLTAEWEFLLHDREAILNLSSSTLPKNVLSVAVPEWSDNVVQVNIRVVERIDPLDPNSSTTEKNRTAYLVDLRAGIYQACIVLPESERIHAERLGAFPSCVSYLALTEDINRERLVDLYPWLEKMRNLAISCSLVTLILVASTILLGAFGLVFKQLSALMVTGVLFLMAGVFGIFTYCFMIFRRTHLNGVHTGTVYDKFLLTNPVLTKYRYYEGGWAAQLGAIGIFLCFASSALWMLLARCLIRLW